MVHPIFKIDWPIEQIVSSFLIVGAMFVYKFHRNFCVVYKLTENISSFSDMRVCVCEWMIKYLWAQLNSYRSLHSSTQDRELFTIKSNLRYILNECIYIRKSWWIIYWTRKSIMFYYHWCVHLNIYRFATIASFQLRCQKKCSDPSLSSRVLRFGKYLCDFQDI